jgi:hypothetical protein
MDTETLQGVKIGQGVTLTPHPLLVPWSWKSSPIALLPLWAVRFVQSLSACKWVHFNFLDFARQSLCDNDKLSFSINDGMVSITINTWYRVVWYMGTDVSGRYLLFIISWGDINRVLQNDGTSLPNFTASLLRRSHSWYTLKTHDIRAVSLNGQVKYSATRSFQQMCRPTAYAKTKQLVCTRSCEIIGHKSFDKDQLNVTTNMSIHFRLSAFLKQRSGYTKALLLV